MLEGGGDAGRSADPGEEVSSSSSSIRRWIDRSWPGWRIHRRARAGGERGQRDGRGLFRGREDLRHGRSGGPGERGTEQGMMDVVDDDGGAVGHLSMGVDREDQDPLPHGREDGVGRDASAAGSGDSVGMDGTTVAGRRDGDSTSVIEVLVGGHDDVVLVPLDEGGAEDEQLLTHHGAGVVGHGEDGPGEGVLDGGDLIGDVGDAEEGVEGEEHSRPDLGGGIEGESTQSLGGLLADAHPLGIGIVGPELTDAEAGPLAETGVLGIAQVSQAGGHDGRIHADELSLMEALAKDGDDEGAHGAMLAHVGDGDGQVGVQDLDEVLVTAVLE